MSRLLVIEDQKKLLQSLERGLSEEGYQVIPATTWEEGYLQARSVPVDAEVALRVPRDSEQYCDCLENMLEEIDHLSRLSEALLFLFREGQSGAVLSHAYTPSRPRFLPEAPSGGGVGRLRRFRIKENRRLEREHGQRAVADHLLGRASQEHPG
jgi:hypothetical protein